MTKTKKRIAGGLIAVVLALSGAGAAYAFYQRAPAPQTGATTAVRRGNLTETAAASGKIEPAVQVDVKSRASGEVAEVLVKEGDVVSAGQLLVRLDKTDALRDLESAKVARDRAKADVASAGASVQVAELDQANNKTSQELAQRSAELGLGTTDASRTAGYATKVSAANLGLRRAQLSAAQLSLKTAELNVQDAETRLKETDIFAPIAGTVLSVGVEKGTIVSSALTNVGGGSAVITLADLSDLRVIGSIDEAQIGRVKPGQSVEIRVDAYPSQVFKGTVDRVSPLGVETSSVVTFDVEVRVTDAQASLLRSGMSADLEIVTAEQQGVLLVPLSAIQSKNKNRFVKLQSGEERPIETGSTNGTDMVVTSGLDEGDTILASAPLAASTSTSKSQSSMRGGMMGPPPGGR
jgi:HlyD family secretion protein